MTWLGFFSLGQIIFYSSQYLWLYFIKDLAILNKIIHQFGKMSSQIFTATTVSRTLYAIDFGGDKSRQCAPFYNRRESLWEVMW